MNEVTLQSISVDEAGKVEIHLADKTVMYFQSREGCEEYIARDKEPEVLRMAGQWLLDQIDLGVDPATITNKLFRTQSVIVEDA